MAKWWGCVPSSVLAVLVIMVLAIASAAQSNLFDDPETSPLLLCGPAPCVFPPLVISPGAHLGWTSLSVAVNPANPAQLVVAATEFFCASGERIYSSEDEGATWGWGCLPTESDTLSAGIPILAYARNGILYAGTDELEANGRDRVVISSSTDNGKTWGTPASVLATYTLYATRLEVDNGLASPFQGSLYISGGVSERGQVIIMHSNDEAKTWTTTVVNQDDGWLLSGYPSVAVAGDGTVYATWLLCKVKPERECAGRVASMMISKSTDGGNSWSVPVQAAKGTLSPDNENWPWGVLPGTVIPVSNTPVAAVDNSNGPNAGNVYVAFYDYKENLGSMHVGVVTSKDHGQTWGPVVRVSWSQGGDQFFHWVSVSQDGTIGVTWLDTRHAGRVKFQPYFAISTDGGATFTGDRPLASGLSDPLKDPFTDYFGEFRTHIWDGKALYAVWQDNHADDKGNLHLAIGGVQF